MRHQHTRSGCICAAINLAHHRAGVRQRLGRARNDLDDSVRRECTRSELDGDRFFAMYFGGDEGLRGGVTSMPGH